MASKTKTSPALPKQIYITWHEEGFLLASVTVDDAADGETVGVYTLAATKKKRVHHTLSK